MPVSVFAEARPKRRHVLRAGLAGLWGISGCRPSLSAALRDSGRRVDVRSLGARGDGVTDDRPAIQAAVDRIANAGGGEVVIPAGHFMLASAIIPRSGVTIVGIDRERSILKAAPGSTDNVVGIDYLVEGQVAAARHGKRLDRLMGPDFSALSETNARKRGGYAGYGVVDFHLRDLTIDGNKAQCPENSNLLVTGLSDGSFAPGQTIRSSSGGRAMVAAVFPQGSPPALSIRPSTIGGSGQFEIGDEIVGPQGRFVLTGRRGDDAYQVGVVFHAATDSGMTGCIVRDTVYQGIVVYNACTRIAIADNIVTNPNRSGTVYKGGNVHIYCDFDNRSVQITGNRLQGGGGYGIVISENGGRTDDVLIAGNTIIRTPGDAIRVASESTSSSATLGGIRIIDNRIAECGDTAIRLVHQGRANGLIRPVVTGNRIRDSRFGILLAGRIDQPMVARNIFADIAGVALDLGAGPVTPTI